jgi:hypothetical protein
MVNICFCFGETILRLNWNSNESAFFVMKIFSLIEIVIAQLWMRIKLAKRTISWTDTYILGKI